MSVLIATDHDCGIQYSILQFS